MHYTYHQCRRMNERMTESATLGTRCQRTRSPLLQREKFIKIISIGQNRGQTEMTTRMHFSANLTPSVKDSSHVFFSYLCILHVFPFPTFAFFTCFLFLPLYSSRVFFSYLCILPMCCFPTFVFFICVLFLPLYSSRVFFSYLCILHMCSFPTFVFFICVLFLSLYSSRVFFSYLGVLSHSIMYSTLVKE